MLEAGPLSPQQIFIVIASVALALAVTWFASVVVGIVFRPVPSQAQSHEFEKRRRMRLRDNSTVYRWFEPLVDDVCGRVARWCGDGRKVWVRRLLGLNDIQQNLRRGGDALPWTASEYAAIALMKSVAIGCTVFLMATRMFHPGFALICTLGMGSLFYHSELSGLRGRARGRLARLKQRLPYGVDLMALMMQAGATFTESLGTMVNENREHPLGVEFGRVLRENGSGKPLHSAMLDLRDRLRDDDITEIVFSTNNAEQLGAPMSKIYLQLAEQMRLRRSQRAEKAVGSAQAMMTFPGFVIMLACLLIMVAPFLLAHLTGDLF